MSLVITRRPGEAIVSIGPDGQLRRLYVVAIEGNVVRLALDAPRDVRLYREELLPPEARRKWWEDSRGVWGKIAVVLGTTYCLERLLFIL